MKFTIASCSDARYFPLLKELVLSIRALDTAGACDISIISAGIRDDQLREISDQVTNIKDAEWDLDIRRLKKEKEYKKAFTCRPFLPRYFPGYDVYIWIDAGAWISDWSAIDLYTEGATRGALAITSAVDRAYPAPKHHQKIAFTFGHPFFVPRTFLYKHAKRAFGYRMGRELASYPLLCGGAFALHRDAPHWQAWANYMERGLASGKSYGIDQLSINCAIYRDNHKIEILPAWCNWLCHSSMPLIDAETGKLVEPYLPNHPIGVVHLTCFDDMRADPSVTVDVRSTDGQVHRRSLRYPAFRRA